MHRDFGVVAITSSRQCILFDFRLKHRGLANNSKKPRPLMYITYCIPSWKDGMNFNTRRCKDSTAPLLRGTMRMASHTAATNVSEHPPAHTMNRSRTRGCPVAPVADLKLPELDGPASSSTRSEDSYIDPNESDDEREEEVSLALGLDFWRSLFF